MNLVVLMGRLTKDPTIKYSTGENQTCVARFTLAVDRRYKREGEQNADFISCVAFGKTGEFVEKYASKGKKFVISGRIQTGNYEKDGQTIYTTDVVVSDMEFAESKRAESEGAADSTSKSDDGFVNVPDAGGDGRPLN